MRPRRDSLPPQTNVDIGPEHVILVAEKSMAETIEISLSDNLVRALGATASELPRRTLEALVVQSYRSGQLSHSQVAEALNLDRWQTDSFLKKAQAYRNWEPTDFSADLDILRKIVK